MTLQSPSARWNRLGDRRAVRVSDAAWRWSSHDAAMWSRRVRGAPRNCRLWRGEATGLAGGIEPAPLDVTDREATAKVVGEIEGAEPIVLAFLNAGGSLPIRRATSAALRFVGHFELNVFGVANGLNPFMNTMKARGRGQIAINGSLIGYGGMPGPAPIPRARRRSSIWPRAQSLRATGAA